jgi:hypothetical protein
MGREPASAAAPVLEEGGERTSALLMMERLSLRSHKGPSQGRGVREQTPSVRGPAVVPGRQGTSGGGRRSWRNVQAPPAACAPLRLPRLASDGGPVQAHACRLPQLRASPPLTLPAPVSAPLRERRQAIACRCSYQAAQGGQLVECSTRVRGGGKGMGGGGAAEAGSLQRAAGRWCINRYEGGGEGPRS